MTNLNFEKQSPPASEPDSRLPRVNFASGGNQTFGQKADHPLSKTEPSKDLSSNEILMRQSLDGRF